MRGFLKIVGIAVALLLVIGGALVARALYVTGYFEKVEPHFTGKCEAVGGLVGVEDIELDRANGTLFLSSQDRRPNGDGKLAPGTIFVAAADKLAGSLWAAFGGFDAFHPHGISLYTDPTGRQTLAVVNHPTARESEVLLLDVSRAPGIEPTLTVRRTVKGPLLHHLNDITLVSHEKFYATNDHGSETALGEQLEEWLPLSRASVVYYDGSAAQIAASGFNLANGINRNADASEIYVTDTTGRTLSTFRRDTTAGTLVLTHSLAIRMGLDNIDVDAGGDLWIAAHPRLFDFLGHIKDAKKRSPSAVVRVHPEGDATTHEIVYLNAGEEISASSVAVAHDGRLFVGAVFDPKVLSCVLAK